MDKLDLLKSRKADLASKTADLRKSIFEVIDDASFVELNAFNTCKNEYFAQDEERVGVITGYATVDGYPVYVIAQNSKVNNGALTAAGCSKIANCLVKANANNTPVIYFLSSQGVQMGEGVQVLDGIASILALSNELKSNAPQFAIAIGDVYGSTALLLDNADFTFVINNACVSYASPAVISASKEGGTKESVAKAQNGLKTFELKDLGEAKNKILSILGVLPNFSGLEVDSSDDMNRTSPTLNVACDAKSLIKATFDQGSFVEMNENYRSEVITGIGRIGGIATAGIVFDGGEKGVDIELENVLKIKNFVNFVYDNELPLVLFVNSNGIKIDASTHESAVMTEVMNMLYGLSSVKRVTVVYGKAIGFGYTAFASNASGSDYTYAFAGSKISLLDGFAGVSATFGTVDPEKVDELNAKYEESQDSYYTAKIGSVDNVIEPEFVRQYVISALQMIIG